LKNSGIAKVGGNFFFDPYVMTTGVFNHDLGIGAMMATGLHLADEGIVLSDMQYPRLALAIQGMGVGRLSSLTHYRRTLPIMIKIRDEMAGSIDGRGRMNKSLTVGDRQKLERGKQIATEILSQSGAKKIWHTLPGAAHPGGTCPMGQAVDANLQAELDNLYVCDASVIPAPFGIPPTLTCLALGKRLAAHLLAV
jgi:choline dehydrogenase-like flavoprotein